MYVTSIPPAEDGRRDWQHIADMAMAVAPDWLVLEDEHARQAYRMRRGLTAGFRNPGDWHIVTRNNTRQNKCTIYIKFVGKK